MPKTWSEARIIVFSKPGKDPSRVESYRPISLLNHDAKIFASVMARWLNMIVTKYVHHDQAGFMPTRQLADNVRRTLNLIHHCSSNNTPMLVMALDAEKAFDCLETGYLLRLLGHMNFGPKFLRTIRAMYSEPRAKISINNLSSEDFRLSRGTRQGCPLSPILFALSLEPLAEAIRSSPSITGVDVGGTCHVISLFADDTMIYITDPTESLKHLMSLIGEFGVVSGFVINWTQTVFVSGQITFRYQMCHTSAVQL